MSDNVVEMPRREAWITTLTWDMPDVIAKSNGAEEYAMGGLRGILLSSWIVDCDPARDATYDADAQRLTARFEVTEEFALHWQTNRVHLENVIAQLMPGATLVVERGVWERSRASTPTPPIDHENWHPRCVALLSVLADSEHPEADAERYAVLELLRNAVRRVV